MKAEKLSIVLLLILIIIAAIFFMNTIQAPQKTFFWKALFNAGHVPLFGVISLAVLGLSIKLLSPYIRRRSIHYLISLLVTAGIGLITEIIQYYSPRDADFVDIIRDVIGAIVFLLFYMTFDKQLPALSDKNRRKFRVIIRTLAVIICLAAFIPAGIWAKSYHSRQMQFPLICGFDSCWETMFVEGEDAQLQRTAAPPKWDKSPDDKVACLIFDKADFPGIAINEPYPDWTGYSAFSFEIFSPYGSSLKLSLRINDTHHDYTFYDRFNTQLKIDPGGCEYLIPVESILYGSKTRDMDMTSIAMIKIFAHKPDTSFTLYFDNFKLIRDDIPEYMYHHKNRKIELLP